VKHQISISYVEKLTKVINAWGEFYSEETLTYFKKLPYPQGLILEQINANAKATGEGAYPMNREILRKLKKLPEAKFNYLHACFYFGLRPSELDKMIKDKKQYQISKENGVPVLSVNQSKLTSLAESKRWKLIPAILPEQLEALENLRAGNLSKPLMRSLKKVAPEIDNLGLYSGRKGFTDLMLGHGQSLEDISMWMGHKSLDRTWKHYKNKKKINFTPIKKAR
jgi:integrase